ncbi:NAD(P)H-binding protein [Qipengyuania qiaonensis]|uniref:NAD(P)H-binding protein n=1 Tax=Qipengyuania qiaonensis TaxID=2867240 RepID=A0ABS7JFT4_9SPHN|nr:NAD(P)H-binding protein [Qipengyuania qiaonensis]MBX7483897.1 NAD(P)H-binding protein [Qipengyuania qiaonensis]
MIVITAPTGDIGTRVTEHILESGKPFRVIARDPSKLPRQVRDSGDIVEGSHSDQETLERAFDGATRLFWLVPSDPTATDAEAAYVGFSAAAAKLLPSSGITHVVSISALGRGWPDDAGHASASIRMDDMLKATGVNYAALACASLMSNVARQADVIRETGAFYYPAPADLKLRHVAPEDIAKVSAGLLLDANWEGFYEVPMIGPEDLTFTTMTSILSEIVGREVNYFEISMADMKAIMLQNGASEGMAVAMIEMLKAKNSGLDQIAERTPADIANSPTSFRTWAEKQFS